MIVWPISP